MEHLIKKFQTNIHQDIESTSRKLKKTSSLSLAAGDYKSTVPLVL